MKHFKLLPALVIAAVLAGMLPAALAASNSSLSISARIMTYSISHETHVRDSAGPCGADEYLSLVYFVKNEGDTEIYAKTAYTRIDGGQKLIWQGGFNLGRGQSIRLHVYYVNMAKLAAGTHKCVLYINDRAVSTQTVDIPRSWNSVLSIPGESRISAANRNPRGRSPYIAGDLQTGNAKYTEYSIDLKADYLPNGTYVCAANWYRMDYSGLKKRYARVDTDGIGGYGGLQKWDTGETHAILSLWNVRCWDRSGNLAKVYEARQVYPPSSGTRTFDGEGNGVHVLPSCPFVEGRWYRLLFTCTTSPETGNTVVTQYVTDLTTGVQTKTAAFDLGYPDTCFTGNIAVFLENYHPEFSGDVRTAEFRNARIKVKGGSWRNVNRMYVEQNYDHPGSYRYGSDGRQFWFITTGVGDQTQKSEYFTVKNQEQGRPY